MLEYKSQKELETRAPSEDLVELLCQISPLGAVLVSRDIGQSLPKHFERMFKRQLPVLNELWESDEGRERVAMLVRAMQNGSGA